MAVEAAHNRSTDLGAIRNGHDDGFAEAEELQHMGQFAFDAAWTRRSGRVARANEMVNTMRRRFGLVMQTPQRRRRKDLCLKQQEA